MRQLTRRDSVIGGDDGVDATEGTTAQLPPPPPGGDARLGPGLGADRRLWGDGGPAAPPVESDTTAARFDFDALWQSFDETYPFFVIKEIDWDAARATYRGQLTSRSTQSTLWTVARDMLGSLQDAHVSLRSNAFGYWAYALTSEWADSHPEDFSLAIVRDHYAAAPFQTSADGRLQFGKLTDDIGYIHITDFGGENWPFIDEVGPALATSQALIIDVRDNPGGNDANGRMIAGHFADQRRLFRTFRTRNGPGHADFGAPVADFIDPSGAHFPGPVAVLTNRRVVSSAEGFVLMMRVLPQAVVVGDTTAGASANPRAVTLPNGWTAMVSTWWVQTPDGETFEDVGLAPDVPVKLTPADQAAGRDTALERAIGVLQETLAGG